MRNIWSGSIPFSSVVNSQTVFSYENKNNGTLPPLWLDSCTAKHCSNTLFYSRRTHRGKLVIELRQHGVLDEDGRVLLKSLQLLQKTLLLFLAAVPSGYRLEISLPCCITPLQDHHLHKQTNLLRKTNINISAAGAWNTYSHQKCSVRVFLGRMFIKLLYCIYI